MGGRNQNPGLARRFNASMPVRFEDYGDQELAVIMNAECKRLGLEMPLAVRKAALARLAKLRNLPNFGNAGALQTLLADAKARKAARLQVGIRRRPHGGWCGMWGVGCGV